MALSDADSSPRYIVISKRFMEGIEENRLRAPPGLCDNLGQTKGLSNSLQDMIADNTGMKEHSSDSLSDTTVGAAMDAKGSDAWSDDDMSPRSVSTRHMDAGIMRSSHMQGFSDGGMFPCLQQWPNYTLDDSLSKASNVGGELYPGSPGSLVEQLISMNAQLLAQNQLLWKSGLGMPWPSNSGPTELAGACNSNTAQARSNVKLSGKTAMQRKEVPNEQRTTIMLRNLPNNFTRDMLKKVLDKNGFFGLYDFLYLPIDFQSGAALGYAFVNLLDTTDVQHFWTTFQGYSTWPLPSKKVCKVSWSDPHQGLQSQIDLYRDSPVMHESVPDEYRPICLADGVRVPFPEPNKAPRAPRFRRSGGYKAQRRAVRT